MFRNTRASVQGFPQRKAVPHRLQEDSWEAKFEWLADFARKNPGKKILVICHAVEQVRDCEAHLWQKHGIHVALFHEDMDLVERDSAAAYFADLERGCPLLLCSEIGSEGRNFQFSHHLVCLDLPDHPDVLEQRIGRLDRIGQQQTVNIHIPFAEGSADAEKFVWYHEVLQCIDRQSPAAGAVHDQYWLRLTHSELDAPVWETAHQALQQLETQIQQGRDALLEMNSCRQPQADELVAAIAGFEQETPLALVEQASELFNFHFEETQGGAYSLIPADNMLIPSLPGIPLDGIEVTFDRALANAREDVLFLTWDSPFITGLWEILHHSDLGSASVAFLPSKQLPPGKCLLETCFDLLIQSAQATACLPFLTDLSVRALVLDMGEKDLSDALPELSFEKSLTPADKKLARKIIQSRKDVLAQWYHKAEKFADAKCAVLVQQAVARVEDYFAAEIERLEDLARRNPNVDPAEVEALRTRREGILHALRQQVQVQLSAIRLVVTTAP
jgi:ATP-dependent helicase HepA